MISQGWAFRARESANHQLDVKSPKGIKLLVSASLFFVVWFFMMPASIVAQAPKKEYAQTYHEPFRGEPQKAEDFTLLGADAGKYVKFEAEGLRITLPPGKSRAPTGVATAFGVTGDFEITVRYEILEESSISLTVNMNRPAVKDALNRPVVYDASIRCNKSGPTKPLHIQIFTMRKDAVRLTDRRAAAFTVKEKSGRFRMVRSGADITYYLAEGLAKEFTSLTTHPFGADDLKDVQIYGQTSNPKAALDVRFTDLHISAASLPRKPAPPRIEKVGEPPAPAKFEKVTESKIPTKDYAQTYDQSFERHDGAGSGRPISR